jgi:hypothetical protein
MQSLFILAFVEFLYAKRIACGHCAAGVVVNAVATAKISAMTKDVFCISLHRASEHELLDKSFL